MTPAATPEDSTLLLHAYLDGELDPANALAIERRIATDPAFAAEFKRLEALQKLVRERLPEEAIPPGLRSRIEASVGVKRSRVEPTWRALAASIAITAMVASGATWIARGPQPQDTISDAVVAAHIRSLMAPQPADVISSDQHTVKPWFSGRIPEAPRVVDLSKQDFPLVGGRVDVIGRKPVPTLVYRHRKHLISLIAVPAPAEQALSAAPVRTSDGYNIYRWSENGMTYWAISDLGSGDLGTFVQLFRTATREP
jgi:anti-sigma factor RsiW